LVARFEVVASKKQDENAKMARAVDAELRRRGEMRELVKKFSTGYRLQLSDEQLYFFAELLRLAIDRHAYFSNWDYR
jgi:hypothetical protein